MQRYEISAKMMEPYEQGRFVRYEDAYSLLTASEARVRALEARLVAIVEAADAGKVMKSSNGDAPWLREARAALGDAQREDSDG